MKAKRHLLDKAKQDRVGAKPFELVEAVDENSCFKNMQPDLSC